MEKRRSNQQVETIAQRSSKKRFLIIASAVLLIVIATAFIFRNKTSVRNVEIKSASTNDTAIKAENFQIPTNLTELLAIDPRLGKVDIALMSLLCAEGLPGSEHLDVKGSLQLLSVWTELVRKATEKNFNWFRQKPAEFDNSEVVYRMAVLTMTLKNSLGVKYNPRYRYQPIGPVEDDFFADSKNCFVHGVLSQEKLGTCGTMPIVECSIGRRLGYPLKVVRAKSHIFLRWESPDGKVRQNIDPSGDGYGSHPDEYYRQWPVPISDEEVQEGLYLKSLTPEEELGGFLGQRALVLNSHHLIWPSLECFITANKVAPNDNLLRKIIMRQAEMVDEYEAEFRQYMDQKLLLIRDPKNPLAEVEFLDNYQRSFSQIERIKHDLKNP